MSLDKDQEGRVEGIFDRKLVLCADLNKWELPDVIQTCSLCECYFLYCCWCRSRQKCDVFPCHHHRIAFVDGACANSGRPDARAGVAVIEGVSERRRASRPITDSEDDFPLRSTQRAELYSAILGIEMLSAEDAVTNRSLHGSSAHKEARCWILASDSEYLTKGITEWLPKWKVSPSYINAVSEIF
jgi:ribonuclease HI